MSEARFVAAAASVEITPPHGLAMAGYAARTARADGTLDPLEANLLLLGERGGQSVVVVAIDSLAVTRPLRQALAAAVQRATGVQQDHVRVVASHTHSAPLAWVGQIHPVLPGEVDEREIRRVADLVGAAAEGLMPVPCELTWAVAGVDGAGANRHHVDGPHDRTTGALGVVDASNTPHHGTTLAVLFDYACHPTTLGPANLSWSADWVGSARRRIREDRGAVPVVHLPGCAGDVSTRFSRHGRTEAEARRIGELVAAAVLKGLSTGAVLDGGLALEAMSVRLPTRSPKRLPVSVPVQGGSRLDESIAEGVAADRAIRDAGLPSQLDLPVSWLAIGEARWLFLPVEPFARFGLLMSLSPRPVRVVGYCDAYHGYMPDDAAYRAGHYEARSALVDEGAAAEFYRLCMEAAHHWTSGSGPELEALRQVRGAQ